MLDSLSPARRRFALGSAGLVALALLAVVGVMAFRALDAPEPVAQSELGPVLMVSGYGGSVDDLEPLAGLVSATGRDVVVLPPVGDGTGDLGEQAEALGEVAREAVEDGAPSVDVVGYSAGGVVARAWVSDHGGAELARRVVTIGSPHHGTDLAQFALDAAGTCPEACVQLTPDSGFLRALNAGDETPTGPAFVSVWTDSDQVVTPPDSARLKGAANVTVQELCPGATTSHGSLPDDPAVVAVVRAALEVGAFETPSGVAC
jgi:triacylglycerol lipase